MSGRGAGRTVGVLLAALLGLIPVTGLAQLQATPLAAGEVVQLDGRLDEAVWQRAPAYDDFRQFDPFTGSAAPHRTNVRIAFDEKALYVAIVADDPDPARIRAPRVRHDHVIRDQDFVVIYVDGVGTRAAAQWFRVNAGGAMADGMHTAATDNEDFSPDYEWDAAARVTAQGYTVEVRIPFATLRFAHDGTRPWTVQVARRMPREQTYLFVSAPLTRESPSFIAEMRTLDGFNGPPSEVSWQLRPTITARRRSEQPDDPAIPARDVQVGVDLKLRPRADWVIDATLNPEFSQIALDVPQLSRNRQFAIFLQEKRPFFLEGSDLLQTSTDTLYTRSITSPRWGARATYRGEALAGTLLAAADRGGGTVLLPGPYSSAYAIQPPSHAGSARLRWEPDNAAAPLTLAATVSERRYDGVGENRVAGPDAVWRVNHDQIVRAQWLASFTSALPDATGTLRPAAERAGHFGNLEWQRNSGVSAMTLRVREASEDFRNDNGFLPQNGFRAERATINRQFRSNAPDRLLNEITPYVEMDRARAYRDGELISSNIRPSLFLTGERGLEIDLQARTQERTRLRAGGTLHEYQQRYLRVTALPNRWLTFASTELTAGERVDVLFDRVRPGWQAMFTVRLRLGDHLEIEPRYDLGVLRADSGARASTETAAQVLSVLHFGARDSLRLIAQRTTYDLSADAQAGSAPLPGFAPGRDSSATQSLVYAHRRNVNDAFYLGAARSRSLFAAGGGTASELFAKLQFAI